jgi:integrase
MPDDRRLWRKKRQDAQGNVHEYGSYYGYYYDRAGGYHEPCLRTRDRSAARRRIREYERGEALPSGGAASHEASYPLSTALEVLINEGVADRPSGTIHCYDVKAGHLNRVLGELDLRTLERRDVEKYILKRKREKASDHTVHKELVVLRRAMILSVVRRVIRLPDQLQILGLEEGARLWAASIVPKHDANYTPRNSYVLKDAFPRLLAALPPHRRMWVLLATYLGFRRSEVEALDWVDVELPVDNDKGHVHVPGTKTDEASNYLPIPATLAKLLREIPTELRKGKVVEPWSNVGRDLPAACKHAGIRRATPNDLRRSFASWLAQAGENTLAISKLMRHHSTRMVERVYAQLADPALVDAVASLPDLPDGLDVADHRRRTGVGNKGVQERRMRRRASRKGLDTAEIRVPRDGVEPPTRGFSVPCSTT